MGARGKLGILRPRFQHASVKLVPTGITVPRLRIARHDLQRPNFHSQTSKSHPIQQRPDIVGVPCARFSFPLASVDGMSTTCQLRVRGCRYPPTKSFSTPVEAGPSPELASRETRYYTIWALIPTYRAPRTGGFRPVRIKLRQFVGSRTPDTNPWMSSWSLTKPIDP